MPGSTYQSSGTGSSCCARVNPQVEHLSVKMITSLLEIERILPEVWEDVHPSAAELGSSCDSFGDRHRDRGVAGGSDRVLEPTRASTSPASRSRSREPRSFPAPPRSAAGALRASSRAKDVCRGTTLSLQPRSSRLVASHGRERWRWRNSSTSVSHVHAKLSSSGSDPRSQLR